MALSAFIRQNTERILEEWERFARSRTPAGEEMSVQELRDHAEAMLKAIATDMDQPQTHEEQFAKSKGESDRPSAAVEAAAGSHGHGRAESGFTPVQMAAEFRALRASVLRLWAEAAEDPQSLSIDEVTRFNEAIDQAMLASVSRFSSELDRARDLLLGVISHDLRNPAGAIARSAGELAAAADLPEVHRRTAGRILDSARRMKSILSDLMDLTRDRLGRGIPVSRDDVDVEVLGRQAVEEVRALHPQAKVRLECTGDRQAKLDAGRIGRALSNLIINAVKHGSAAEEITVTVRGEAERVLLAVHNRGPVIPEERRRRIFEPLEQFRPGAMGPTGAEGLGLGLYIVNQIARAHGGQVDVESSAERGTTFAVCLPRQESRRREAVGMGQGERVSSRAG